MAEQSDDQFSSFQHYQQRLEELMGTAREGITTGPEVLDKAAATANNIARRLEAMASDARQRSAKKEATPESAGTSKVRTRAARCASGVLRRRRHESRAASDSHRSTWLRFSSEAQLSPSLPIESDTP